MIGTECKTRFGWGVILEVRAGEEAAGTTGQDSHDDSSTVVIGLEDFEGWSSSAPPRLITTLSDDVVLSRTLCPVGSAVNTTAGVGVLVDYKRATDEYCVRLWDSGYSSPGPLPSSSFSVADVDADVYIADLDADAAEEAAPGIGQAVTDAADATEGGDPGLVRLPAAAITAVFSSSAELSAAVGGVPMAGLAQLPLPLPLPLQEMEVEQGGCSLEAARALPTVELILGSIPSDVSLQQSALQLITSLMVGLEGVTTSAAGEGITIKYSTNTTDEDDGEEEEAVFDSASILSLSAVRAFVADASTLLEEGEEKVMAHIAAQSLAPEKVTALYDHWKVVRRTIEAVAEDLTGVFASAPAPEDGGSSSYRSETESVVSAASSGMHGRRTSGAVRAEENRSKLKLYLFVVKLRNNVGTIRELFDVRTVYCYSYCVTESVSVSEFSPLLFRIV